MYMMTWKGLQDILIKKNSLSKKKVGGVLNSAAMKGKKCIKSLLQFLSVLRRNYKILLAEGIFRGMNEE